MSGFGGGGGGVAASGITEAQIALTAVRDSHVFDSAITTTKIAVSAVTGARIGARTVDYANMAFAPLQVISSITSATLASSNAGAIVFSAWVDSGTLLAGDEIIVEAHTANNAGTTGCSINMEAKGNRMTQSISTIDEGVTWMSRIHQLESSSANAQIRTIKNTDGTVAGIHTNTAGFGGDWISTRVSVWISATTGTGTGSYGAKAYILRRSS